MGRPAPTSVTRPLISWEADRQTHELLVEATPDRFRSSGGHRTQDSVVFIDSSGAIVEFNRAAEKTFGYEAREPNVVPRRPFDR